MYVFKPIIDGNNYKKTEEEFQFKRFHTLVLYMNLSLCIVWTHDHEGTWSLSLLVHFMAWAGFPELPEDGP